MMRRTIPMARRTIPMARRKNIALVARGHAWRLQRVSSTATAIVFSGLAPAVLMTAIWTDPRVAPLAFVFTFIIALSHAVLFGLPIFLILQSRGWTGITACVLLGFDIGAVPGGILAFPVTNGLSTAEIWVSYIEPLMYLGLLGAFGGLVFWIVLMSSGTSDEHGGHPSNDLRTRLAWRKRGIAPDICAPISSRTDDDGRHPVRCSLSSKCQ
jgi:hypothetical protein